MGNEVLHYTPIDYDAETIPPDAPAGYWNATAAVQIGKTKIKEDGSGGYPMIIVNWVLDQALTAGNEGFEGAQASDFIVFFPLGSRADKMGKLRLRGFTDKLGIPRSLIPKRIESSVDLQPFADAIDGQSTDLWTSLEKDKETGEMRTKVSYREPGKKGADLPPLNPIDDQVDGQMADQAEGQEEGSEETQAGQEEAEGQEEPTQAIDEAAQIAAREAEIKAAQEAAAAAAAAEEATKANGKPTRNKSTKGQAAATR